MELVRRGRRHDLRRRRALPAQPARHRHGGLLQHRLVPDAGVLRAVPRHHPARAARTGPARSRCTASTSRTRCASGSRSASPSSTATRTAAPTTSPARPTGTRRSRTSRSASRPSPSGCHAPRERRSRGAPAGHRHRHVELEGRAGARPTARSWPPPSAPHALSLPRPGWAEHDAETIWWADFLALCRELLARAGGVAIAASASAASGPACWPPTPTASRCARPSSTASTAAPTREIAELTERYGADAILARGGTPLCQPGGRPEAGSGCAATSRRSGRARASS